jgi:hypothetical protein
MDNWFSSVAMEPTWPAIIGAIGLAGVIATVVMLVRQIEPRRKPDLERIARRREPRTAH